jgi:cytochrome c-type biogenesis protein CcmH/NrfF
MRSRSAAALVAAAAAALFWLFPPFLIVATAVMALVVLRQGATEGASIMALGRARCRRIDLAERLVIRGR